MKVVISHIDGMKFEAKTAKSSFVIDCPIISPVEYFLSGIITCSATDIIMLPKKKNIIVTDLKVTGDALRNEDYPQKFNELHLLYEFNSDTDDKSAARYVMASLQTYCSTINTIRSDVKISYSVIHNGDLIADKVELISATASICSEFGEIESCPA